MRVFAYRNLNRKGVVWSLKDVASGRVVARETYAIFKDVKLKVSQAGRRRAIRQGKRNVHAGVEGLRIWSHPRNRTWIKARYNPFETETFVDQEGNPILEAKYAKLCRDGLFVAID